MYFPHIFIRRFLLVSFDIVVSLRMADVEHFQCYERHELKMQANTLILPS